MGRNGKTVPFIAFNFVNRSWLWWSGIVLKSWIQTPQLSKVQARSSNEQRYDTALNFNRTVWSVHASI